MGRTFLFSCYVAVYRCAIIIRIMCYPVKVVKPSRYIRNFKRQISTVTENFSIPVRTFSREISTGKNNSVQLGQNFQNSLPTKLVGSLEPHFCPSWTEVEKLTLTQVVSKSRITSTQLEEKSEFNFYTDCAEVKVAKKQGTNFLRLVPLLFDFWCMVNVLL